MEFLRKLFAQTRSHLQGLTLSQRLAIGACAALVVISLLWLMNWAGEPDRVPLLDQPQTPEEIAQIQSYLDGAGIEYLIKGDRILVPSGARPRLLAQLGQERLLPEDISMTISKLIEQSSPWLSMKEQDRRWHWAYGNHLARMLRGFDGVRDARVFIDKTTRRGLGGPAVAPTASVGLRLASGRSLDEGIGRAAASLVASAVAGLEVYNVAVTDASTGATFRMPRPNESNAMDDFKDRIKKESYYEDEIRSLLAYIPGLQVKVFVDVSSSLRRTQEQEYGKPVPTTERIESETMTRGMPGAEPGVRSNNSVAVTPNTPSETTERSVSETTYKGEVDVKLTTTETPRNEILGFSASLNVPKSYLLDALWSGEAEANPSDEEVDTRSARLLEKIRNQVTAALKIDSSSVQVDWFPDGGTLVMGGQMDPGDENHGVMSLVTHHWDKAGLAGLALISLAMMLMVVRRSGGGPGLPGEDEAAMQRMRRSGEVPPEMMQYEPPVGEAGEHENLLEGKEMDEAAVRTHQVVEQVNELIKNDPAASASILQTWIARER